MLSAIDLRPGLLWILWTHLSVMALAIFEAIERYSSIRDVVHQRSLSIMSMFLSGTFQALKVASLVTTTS